MIIKCPNCSQKNRIPAARLSDGAKCGKCEQALRATGVARPVDATELDDLIANSPLPVVVDFWAPWCGPCRAAAPEVERLAATRSDLMVVKLNTDEHPQVAAREGVRGIPMFAVYRDGRRLNTATGMMRAEQLASALGI